METERRSELARSEAELEAARDELARSVAALREEVVLATDWREWVRRRPGTVLAASFALGFLLGHSKPAHRE